MSENHWTDRLDAAIRQQFPEVECETFYSLFTGFCGSYVTRWWQAGTEDTKLKPALARQVKAFVAGFMASEEGRKRPAGDPLHFEVYQVPGNGWYWRLTAGRVVIAKAPYGRRCKATVLKHIERIRQGAEFSQYEVKEPQQ